MGFGKVYIGLGIVGMVIYKTFFWVLKKGD